MTRKNCQIQGKKYRPERKKFTQKFNSNANDIELSEFFPSCSYWVSVSYCLLSPSPVCTLFSDHTEQSCYKLIPQMCFVYSEVYSKRCILSASRSWDNHLCNFQVLVHMLPKHINYWKHSLTDITVLKKNSSYSTSLLSWTS